VSFLDTSTNSSLRVPAILTSLTRYCCVQKQKLVSVILEQVADEAWSNQYCGLQTRQWQKSVRCGLLRSWFSWEAGIIKKMPGHSQTIGQIQCTGIPKRPVHMIVAAVLWISYFHWCTLNVSKIGVVRFSKLKVVLFLPNLQLLCLKFQTKLISFCWITAICFGGYFYWDTVYNMLRNKSTTNRTGVLS